MVASEPTPDVLEVINRPTVFGWEIFAHTAERVDLPIVQPAGGLYLSYFPRAVDATAVVLPDVASPATPILTMSTLVMAAYAGSPASSPKAEGFSAMIDRLAGLIVRDADEDEEDKPELAAVMQALMLLAGAHLRVKSDFPMGLAVGDGYGGVYVYWKHGNRHLQLIVPTNRDETPALYQRLEGESGHDYVRNVSASTLAERLDWLNGL